MLETSVLVVYALLTAATTEVIIATAVDDDLKNQFTKSQIATGVTLCAIGWPVFWVGVLFVSAFGLGKED